MKGRARRISLPSICQPDPPFARREAGDGAFHAIRPAARRKHRCRASVRPRRPRSMDRCRTGASFLLGEVAVFGIGPDAGGESILRGDSNWRESAQGRPPPPPPPIRVHERHGTLPRPIVAWLKRCRTYCREGLSCAGSSPPVAVAVLGLVASPLQAQPSDPGGGSGWWSSARSPPRTGGGPVARTGKRLELAGTANVLAIRDRRGALRRRKDYRMWRTFREGRNRCARGFHGMVRDHRAAQAIWGIFEVGYDGETTWTDTRLSARRRG